MTRIQEIGVVHNAIKTSTDPSAFRDVESVIEVHPSFIEGLYRIEENEYVVVVFDLDRAAAPDALKRTTRSGEVKGVFASRSPHRPSAIGVTTVPLLGRDGRQLRVRGLDALDGSPVLDLKPYVPSLDAHERAEVLAARERRHPRVHVVDRLLAGDRETLLVMAARLHGHYCNGLALGIHLATRAMHEVRELSDGVMEDLIAIVEMNNCAADGVQFVTGSTFGNNALVFRDLGKMALTLVRRVDGRGVRVTVKPDWREHVEANPELTALFQKVVRDRAGTPQDKERMKGLAREASFLLVNAPSDAIVSVDRVTAKIPPYAPIHDSFTCGQCGESTMASRAAPAEKGELCLTCAGNPFFELTGDGIHAVTPSER